MDNIVKYNKIFLESLSINKEKLLAEALEHISK